MQTAIHPKWYSKTRVSCACGNTFTIGATMPEIKVEICSNCHPYFTGQMKFVDTKGRVDAFLAKQKSANKAVLSKSERRRIKREKKIKEELERPETLAEVRKSLKREKLK